MSIKQLKFYHSKIKKNLSFVFLSDIHIGSNSPKILKKIVHLINQENPKFVLIGGDLIDSSSFKIYDLDERIVNNNLINFTIFDGNNEINIFFDKKTYDLIGWQNTDMYQNFNITFLSSVRKNRVLSKNLFKIPFPD